MKKIVLLLLYVGIFSFYTASGQAATATIGTAISCHNSEVLVPVNIENFISVGAMTLFIVYDTMQLRFTSLVNIHPNFASIIYNVNTLPRTQIAISYMNSNGTTVTAGKLFDMKFTFVENSTPLAFYVAACEVTKPDGDNIPVTYFNGGVNPLIKITSQPQNQTVYQPQPASFSVASVGGTLFQWQISSNGGASFSSLSNSAVYQGVTTESLSLLSTNSLLSGRIYRCMISNGTCIKYSANALLTVLSYQNQTIQLPEGWSSLASYLDPVNVNLEVLFAPLGSSLQMVLSDGKVYYPEGGVNTIGVFDPTKGYAMKLNHSESFNITGSPLTNKSLTIPQGWSYLPVISNCNVTISALFSQLITEVEIIMELPGVNVFWPEKSISTLQTLQVGRSYKVKMKSDVIVTYPVCGE